MSSKANEFTIPARYYSRAQQAHVHKPVTLDSANTVLWLYHTSNMGYPGVLELRKDSRFACVLALFEHVPRMRRIIDEHIVPLVESARGIGIQVMHAVDGWQSSRTYPQWQAVNARASEVKTCVGPESPNKQWMEEYEADTFMPGYAHAMRELREFIDIAPPLSPRPEDWVVTSGRQVDLLMREKGLWNVLYAGFDTQYDLRFSEVVRCEGTYRFFLLRDCTAGPERHDTIDNEGLKNAAIVNMEIGMRSYSALGSGIRSAISSNLR